MVRQDDPSGVCSVNTQFKPQSVSQRITSGIQQANSFWNTISGKAKSTVSQLDKARANVERKYSEAHTRSRKFKAQSISEIKAVEARRARDAANRKNNGSAFRKSKAKRLSSEVTDVTTGQTSQIGDMCEIDPNLVSKSRRPLKHVKVVNNILHPHFAVQSAEEQVVVTFMNAEDAEPVGMISGNNVFSESDQTVGTEIEAFFARPVRITTIQWNESDVKGTNLSLFNPWSLWANNTYVKPKLNNYSWFRGDLKIRVQMTASQFYYGMVKMCYRPLPSYKGSTVANGVGNQKLIQYSQQPHLDLVVADADSWTFTAPFIYPANWVNIQNAASIANLGEIRTYIYSALQSANGVTGTGITITVYAWVENIQLSGASVGFAMQSAEDEYGQGPVSGVASWVANAATYLEDIPVLGPFATATRIGAGAISTIASLFGFTNVPVISDTSPYRPEAFPKMATSEIGFPLEKLTLDPKNELSVDPRIIGLNSGVDEMSLAYLAGRETYLTAATWSTTNLVDDTLFYSLVYPNIYDTDDTLRAVYLTPMAWVARAFKDWRGSIIFRFQIVASKYHKGKLRISFDPSGYAAQNIGNTTLTANVVHTAIIDIGETMNVEFEVPYQQALQFLTGDRQVTTGGKEWNVNTTPLFHYNGDYHNGLITLRVLNPLTAPVASSSVDVQVYVRAGSDIEFANPAPLDETGNLAIFAPQSEELSMNTEADHVELATTGQTADHQYLVHYGENIRSLRTLLHRYELSSMEMIAPSSTAVDQFCQFRKYFYKMPRAPGYQATSDVTAKNQAGTLDVGYNFVNMTNLSWFSNAFLAYRGSINWTFDVASSGNSIQHLKVIRDNTGSIASSLTASNVDVSTLSRKAGLNRACRNSGAAAQAVTDQRTNAGLNVVCPNMSRYKFQLSIPANANLGSATDGSDLDAFVLIGDFPFPTSATTSNVVISTYNATGVDFGFYFFVNVPAIYNYVTVPLPT